MNETYQYELFQEREPDNTSHVYLREGNRTYNLTYLEEIGLTSKAGAPSEQMSEAALAHNCTVELIAELLELGAKVRW
jgi:hypothetical protein